MKKNLDLGSSSYSEKKKRREIGLKWTKTKVISKSNHENVSFRTFTFYDSKFTDPQFFFLGYLNPRDENIRYIQYR